jgi:hypothetical protein
VVATVAEYLRPGRTVDELFRDCLEVIIEGAAVKPGPPPDPTIRAAGLEPPPSMPKARRAATTDAEGESPSATTHRGVWGSGPRRKSTTSRSAAKHGQRGPKVVPPADTAQNCPSYGQLVIAADLPVYD